MCTAGFNSCEIMTPRSRQDGTDDNVCPSIQKSVTGNCALPMLKIQHLSNDTVNCQVHAQLANMSNAFYNLQASWLLTI